LVWNSNSLLIILQFRGIFFYKPTLLLFNYLRYLALPGSICNLLNIFCFINSFQKCALQLLWFQATQAQAREGAGFKLAPKSSLNRWGCACQISLRLTQGFGFPFALYIPTDVQTNTCTNIYNIHRLWMLNCVCCTILDTNDGLKSSNQRTLVKFKLFPCLKSQLYKVCFPVLAILDFKQKWGVHKNLESFFSQLKNPLRQR